MDIASNWAGMCRRAQSHALLMAQGRSSQVANLILQEAKRFCEQPLPQTDPELSLRFRQTHALNSIICTICHADNMARSHPAIVPRLLEEAKKCCGLPTTDPDFKALEKQINETTSSIRNLCFDELSRRTIEQPD